MTKDLKPIKILIVDDEERFLRILRLGLKPLNYEVRTAPNGKEALQCLLDDPFDIVVSDNQMPRMSGIELVYEMERLNIAAPIIIMTAYADVETAVKSLKHGAHDYIRKPFTVEELHAVVQDVLKRQPNTSKETALLSLKTAIEVKEKEVIQKALLQAQNNKTTAAQLLNISERTLWYKVKKYDL